MRGELSVGFENFTLATTRCNADQWIWLAFGGDVPGVVPSMVNDMERKAGTDIRVNGISYAVTKDDNLRRLYALITSRRKDKPVYRVTATFIGSFFAGSSRTLRNGKTQYAGYGHLGCCSLLVITQVTDVSSVPPANLSVHGTVVGADGKPVEAFAVVNDIIGGSPPLSQQVLTNSKGAFTFPISGQLLRVQDPRYRPMALPVKAGGAPIHIKLQEARRSDWKVPACPQAENSANRVGFAALFALPASMDSELNSYPEQNDFRGYYIFPHGGEASLAELIIATSSDRLVTESSAVESKRSQQRWIKSDKGAVVGIDSRGIGTSGRPWRSAVFWHQESAGYSVDPQKPTAALDQIIDSVCISTEPPAN